MSIDDTDIAFSKLIGGELLDARDVACLFGQLLDDFAELDDRQSDLLAKMAQVLVIVEDMERTLNEALGRPSYGH